MKGIRKGDIIVSPGDEWYIVVGETVDLIIVEYIPLGFRGKIFKMWILKDEIKYYFKVVI